MGDYISRYIEKQVAKDVTRKMVFIGGPRQSGKTTLAKHLCQQAGCDVQTRYLSWDSAEDRENIIRERFPAGPAAPRRGGEVAGRMGNLRRTPAAVGAGRNGAQAARRQDLRAGAGGPVHDFLWEPESGRRQDMRPRAYVRNGTIYAFRRDALMGEHGRVFGHVNSKAYIMPAERSVNIDTELDWDLARVLAERILI